jgi:hypothetical protein
LYVYGDRRAGCDAAPLTCSLLSGMDEVVGRNVGNAQFSLMRPGTYVRPHTGPNNMRLRCHLGLQVPAPAEAMRIRVGEGPARSWAEGEVVIFDDVRSSSSGLGSRLSFRAVPRCQLLSFVDIPYTRIHKIWEAEGE